ncbi:Protofilament ribbon protein [Tribonema minus]|uniref:Protofilament ribbon protein n=1 Tax=Tribonema minus TaxID=303371 RepID=A0A836CI01_9STRA|nr:Protofilament ribbon protein [Tribonema minus]
MEVHCAVGGPIPNLPHFQQNKQMPRGRGQGFKVIEGTPVIVDKSETKLRQFQPVWKGLHALSFDAYFKETVDESPLENHRIRRCHIIYYPEDGTLQVDEVRLENSGIPQGTFIKRHAIPRNRDKPADGNLGVEDLRIGDTVAVYGRRFHIVDANESTRAWLEKELGRLRAPAVPFPEAQFDQGRAAIMAKQKGTNHRILKNEMKIFAEAALGKTVDTSKRAGFMRYDREDDTIEVANMLDNNTGRDPYPLLLKRGRLAKDATRAYTWADLRVGATISVYRRPLLLVGADGHTREFYASQGMPLAPPIATEDAPEPEPPREVPPPTGFGSEEDSLASCTGSLVLSPPRRRRAGDASVLRFTARLDTPFEEDVGRQFVITVYGADNTVAVREPPRPNSGFWGGTFLTRSRARREAGGSGSSSAGGARGGGGDDVHLCLQDFACGVGGLVHMNGHPFRLTGADEGTKAWLEMHL